MQSACLVLRVSTHRGSAEINVTLITAVANVE